MNSLFKKGQQVVNVLHGVGFKTATLDIVARVKNGQVEIEGADSMRWDAATGGELDVVIPGFRSELIPMEADAKAGRYVWQAAKTKGAT